MLVATTLALAAAPPRAEAQQKTDKQTKEEANRHFKNGVALYKERKYAEALAEFERAYSLEPHPLVLYNLAVTHRELSQYDQAVTYFTRFLSEGPGYAPQDMLDRARGELDDVLRLVAMVEVRTQPAEGVTIHADGREIGKTPLEMPLVLGPGDHVIEAELDGHKRARRSIRVAAGDALTVDLTLPVDVAEPAPGPIGPTPDTGTGAVTADLGAEPAGTPAITATAAPARRTLGVSAAMGTNLAHIGDAGAPVLGLGYAPTDRVTIGVDVVLVAFAAVPNLRFRIAGDALSVHAIAAAPIAFTDGDDGGGTFAAGAAGLGVRYRATDSLAVRLETWVSYAGSEHGTTVPTFAGAELWF